jgi:hypothetical protein
MGRVSSLQRRRASRESSRDESRLKRLAWFVVIYVASTATFMALVWVIRSALR